MTEELKDQIRQLIKDELRLEVTKYVGGFGENTWAQIRITLNGEEITYADIE